MYKLIVPILIASLLIACSDSKSDAPSQPSSGAQSAGTASAGNSGGARPAGGPITARQTQAFDPESFTLALEPVLRGLRQPLFVTSPPDGSGRLFVVEKEGTIRIAVNGQVQSTPFLDISSLLPNLRGLSDERGLLGLAFHPKYRENGIFFIYYTSEDAKDTLARYRVSSDPSRADEGSTTVLFAVDDPAPNHNGGMLAFGPDGYLYVAIGDGGGANDQFRNGQNMNSLLGKILRLDVDGGTPYAIPPTNPLAGRDGVRQEIWAWGLRNPWRFSFDRETGDLWIADVGQGKYEEINVQPADSRGGENYGWSRMEGVHCFPSGDSCDKTGLVLPIAEYDHSVGVSITGGYVYRGRAQPALTGGYFYGDWGSGRIWSVHKDSKGAWVQTELLKTNIAISSFGEDADGEVYVTDLASGTIYRLTASPR